MHIYDIATDSWTVGASAPSGGYRRTSQVYHHKIYFPQSRGTAMHIYDIINNTWTVGMPAPTAVRRHTSQLYNAIIYCPANDGVATHIYGDVRPRGET